MAIPKDIVSQINKAIRKKFSADGEIRAVLEGLTCESGPQGARLFCNSENILVSPLV
jgi:hypothetical protein